MRERRQSKDGPETPTSICEFRAEKKNAIAIGLCQDLKDRRVSRDNLDRKDQQGRPAEQC
jgi:hypothetical protein